MGFDHQDRESPCPPQFAHLQLYTDQRQWSVQRSSSILTIPAHTGQIYSTTWSPHTPSMLASCAADGLVKIFDIRTQTPQRPIQVFQASPTEVLSCDWNKYDLSTLASGGKDLGVKVWDMRSGRSECVSELRGHTLAVKKVQYVRSSPFICPHSQIVIVRI
jgi:peroxin-7